MKFTGRLGRNIFGLGALQGMNLVVTFLTLPYLTRVLGVQAWGNIVFVLLIVNYGIWVVNWGFYLGATQRIAASRDHKERVSKIACEVWVAQFLLAIISITIYWIFIKLFAEQKLQSVYFAGYAMLIGNLLTPLWFLHGLEKVWEASFTLLMAKIVVLPFIFIYINSENDAFLYLLFNGVGSIVIGIACLYWMYRGNFVYWRSPKIRNILKVIVEDSSFFFTSMTSNLTASIIPTALGIWASPSDLGLFNIADRIKAAAITIFHPVVHALYPRMAYLFSANKMAAIKLLRISGIAIFGSSLLVSFILFLLAPKLILWIGGENFSGAIPLLRILALVPLASTISAFIVHQVLIPLQQRKFYLISSLIILMTTLLLIYPSITYFGLRGATTTMLLAELMGCFCLIFFTWLLRGALGKPNIYV
ncbi:oligosaccharide flippase family protein [Polynucleobacter sinensis]|uniref:oligosaccharide flippase family protein n=1 Tax=Polynucleobacter sinensis TaxID=1743157 RepID=UPI000783310C|nr:oligosaccharide flippase family protein [Polynucleobacter sinensis]